MGLTAIETETTRGEDSSHGDMTHIVCNTCWPDIWAPSIAVCGTARLPGLCGDERLADCAVCHDLWDKPCPGCGR